MQLLKGGLSGLLSEKGIFYILLFTSSLNGQNTCKCLTFAGKQLVLVIECLDLLLRNEIFKLTICPLLANLSLADS